MAKIKEAQKEVNIIEIDAADKILGRLAVEVADTLRGKNLPSFMPHKKPTQKVAVYNTDKLAVTGQKMEDKIYYRHSGYPGGLTETPLKDEMKKDSREVIRKAVYGMLPNNKLRKIMLNNLTLYRSEIKKKKV